MGLLSEFLPGLLRRPPPIDSSAALADFMDRHAAFLAQKSIVEFCRVRAGIYWQKLFTEAEFQAALGQSRWTAYPACFAMMAEMVEGALRPHAGPQIAPLRSGLEALAQDVFARYPVPDGADGDFWQQAGQLVAERLQIAQSRPPRPVSKLPNPLARRVFEAVPIHPSIITNDYDYIFNFLRMNLLRAHEDFENQADMPALVEAITGRR